MREPLHDIRENDARAWHAHPMALSAQFSSCLELFCLCAIHHTQKGYSRQVRFGSVRFGSVRFGSFRFNLGLVRLRSMRCDLMCFGSVVVGLSPGPAVLVRFGKVHFGLGRVGAVRCSVWFGWARFVSVRLFSENGNNN